VPFRADLSAVVSAGFRERPEEWNRIESVDGVPFAKRVFAPPVGQRAMNLHVRASGSAPARYVLLFRDFLRADDRARDHWGAFTCDVAKKVPELGGYGRAKTAAPPLLMARAEQWAAATGWKPGV
jgi:GrpB-like predicted nucleotidyltransferase (UPF0157 family)